VLIILTFYKSEIESGIDKPTTIQYYHLMKKLIIALAVITALASGTYGVLLLTRTEKPTVERITYVQPKPQPLDANIIHDLVNAERAKIGLQPLTIDQRLVQGAQRKADELDETEVFSHKNAEGVSGFTYSGELAPECKKPKSYENLLYNHSTENLGVQWWMGSKAHREAMLSPDITIVGYGIAGAYVAQHLC
jgi:uncharacterized protein YkwD